MDGYLVHHGVHGMHWGHRRWQNYDGSLTPEGYKHYGITPSKEASLLERYKNSYRYKDTKNRYKELSTNPEFVVPRKSLSSEEKAKLGVTDYVEKGGALQKGQKLYRIATTNDSEKQKPIRYYSTSEYDSEKWAREFVPQIGDKSTKDTYVIDDAIKIASAAKLGEEWQKMWLESHGDVKVSDLSKQRGLTAFDEANAKIVESGYGFQGDKRAYDPWSSAGSKFTSEQSAKLRDIAASNLLMTSKKDRDKLIDRLKNQGYGGVGDINGIDVSYDPVIVFDTSKSTKVSSIPYKKSEIEKYEKLYRGSGGDKKYSEIKQISPETRAGKKAIAQSLQRSGSTVDQIARAMGLTLGQVDGLLYGSW